MSACVGKPSDDFIALADELFDVIMKIGKRRANSVYVLFELFYAFQGRAEGTAEGDVGLEGIALRGVGADAARVQRQILGCAGLMLTAESTARVDLHVGGHVLEGRAEPGQRCRADDRYRRQLERFGGIGGRCIGAGGACRSAPAEERRAPSAD